MSADPMDSVQGSKPLVVAIVLTWNDVEMTSECIESVLANDYENLRVVLVDNGSETPCGEEVKRRFPGIELLSLPKNRGFTGGSNAGFDYALELHPRYIHLIGNDSVLSPTAISRLVLYLESAPKVGGASPLIFDQGPERMVQICGGSIDRNFAIIKRDDFHGPYESREWRTREAEFLPLVAVMFRANALRQVGTLDESLGTCWEDYDLLVRFADAGWSFVIVGDAEAVHKGRMTTGHRSPYIVYFLIRNRLICLWRYADLSQTVRRPIYLLLTLFLWPIRGNGWNLARQLAFARGILHFCLGIRGEGHAPADRSG